MPHEHSTPGAASGDELGVIVPLGLEGLRIVGQVVLGTQKICEVTVMGRNQTGVCPRCGQMSGKVHDTRSRRKQDVTVRDYRVVLVLRKRRFRCFTCSRPFTEPDTACGWRRRCTQRLRQAVGEAGLCQPVARVAAQYEVGPRFVRTCVRAVAHARLRLQGLSVDEQGTVPAPRFLGIDEFARRKGARYDTLLCDLERRRALEVSAGRTHDEVVALLERLDAPERVEAVSMDMSRPFREAVRLVLPGARVVADHFHVVQHVGRALGKVVRRCARSALGRDALRGQRHLFVRRRESLDPDEQQRRARLAGAFPDLAAAYDAKEALRIWYATATAPTAAPLLDGWITAVERDGPDELRQALSAFRDWREEILAFFHFLPLRLTNGFVEGKNNRTKALMRQAYGYRNRDNLRLRILTPVA